jgi:hypothetical protein
MRCGTRAASRPATAAAARELAEVRILELDRQLPRRRWISVAWLLLALATLTFGVLTARHHGWFLAIYSGLWFGRAVLAGPWLLRRERRRAEAAVWANAGG